MIKLRVFFGLLLVALVLFLVQGLPFESNRPGQLLQTDLMTGPLFSQVLVRSNGATVNCIAMGSVRRCLPRGNLEFAAFPL